MPNGVFPVPKVRTTRHPAQRWGLRSHLRARLQRNTLDRQLAAGARPATRTPLGLRSAQLSSPAGRTQLANALVEAVGEARRGEPMNIGRRPQRAQVRTEADAILALASRLREPTPIDVRGAAMVALLVNDGAGPLHRPGTRTLGDALTEAHGALIPPHGVDHDLAAAA
jgi:hypothetical protein